MDAITSVPVPVNEPIRSYAPGSAERASLEKQLAELAGRAPVELTAVIGGEHRPASGDRFEVTMPSDHHHVLGVGAGATTTDTEAANGPYSPAQPTDLRVTARQVRLRFDEVNASDWRIGVPRLGVLPGSRR